MAIQKRRLTFISYSRVNKEFALRLATELKESGFDVWLDQLDIPAGARWDDEIEKALHECGIFLVILTPASIASENAKDEIGYAIDHGKRILPVLLEKCEIPLRLRRFQYVDFTRLNYSDGVRIARKLLAELMEDESLSPQAKTSRSKERPTQPAKIRTAGQEFGHKKTAPAPTARSTKKRLLTMHILVWAGIAVAVMAALLGGSAALRGMFVDTAQPAPSATTPKIIVTATPTVTLISDTPTPEMQNFYTEEFDSYPSTWKFWIKTGREIEFNKSVENGKLVIQITPQQDEPWAYLINNEFSYTDVQIDVLTANHGNSSNGVSIICRYSELGWYEFWVSNNGNYGIYAFGPDGIILENGYQLEVAGSPAIHTGKSENLYTAVCKGNALSLEINNTPVITTQTKYDFSEGTIGIGFSSPENLPVEMDFESVKVSRP